MASLLRLATLLRAGQVYAHHAHNTCNGPQFFSDHEFLGEVYAAYENDYDAVIERHIGLGGEKPDSYEIMRDALDLLDSLSEDCFASLGIIDKSICNMCSELCNQKGTSEGTSQLVGEICNQAEMRMYKLRQRLAGD